MRNLIFLILTVLFQYQGNSQEGGFPGGWQGTWSGELLWYQQANAEPKRVPMQLRINRIDSALTWQLIYGEKEADNRPYTLVAIDSTNGHWRIDENNGILIDMYWLGQRFSGSFTVGQVTIMNSYWLQGEKLMAEFFVLSAKPVSTTGKGIAESPIVNSYQVRGYQFAELKRN